MRVMLRYPDNTPYITEVLSVMLDDSLPIGDVGDVLNPSRIAMYITSAEDNDELTFVVLPVCTAYKLMDELLCNGFLDLSKYMDTTFIQYESYDKSRLKKVYEDQQ